MNELLLLLILAVPLAAAAIAVRLGARRWKTQTAQLRDRLRAERTPIRRGRVEFTELRDLPAPVQAYLQAALTDGQPVIRQASLQHRGRFNMGVAADKWRSFTSDQLVVTSRPGFDWNARISLLPGMPVRVHDAYIAGQGMLQASLYGLLTVANIQGGREMAEGELMRFLAEALWYPTALLPGQGVHWTAVDRRSAKATLHDHGNTVTLLFTFGDDGLVEAVSAEARGRMVRGTFEPTPWQGRFRNYGRRDGMQIPSEGEVAWLTPEGRKTYWRGTVTDISYEFA